MSFTSLPTPAPSGAFDSQFQPSRGQTPVPRSVATPSGPPSGQSTLQPASSRDSGANGVSPTQAQTRSKKLKIGSALDGLESTLSQIVQSVSTFAPDPELVTKLVDADKEVSDAVDELVEHQKLRASIKELERTSSELDSRLNQVLIELSSCRRELQALPSVSSKGETVQVNAGELLKYATKITKFTQAPPRYNPSAPEHANFPWPSDDELRRGALAMSAVDSGQQEQADKNESATDKRGESTNEKEKETTAMPTTKARRGSLVDYGERPVVEPTKKEPEAAVVDLDLFDPDEDDD
uniref:Mediator of RNA polymerase II transcription subunit 4 n=1 Tax=Blastobotrys adeninivorans TaxID=409370 RepID=A0A060T1U3_BLAAD